MSYSAKIGFGPVGRIATNIQNGQIDEHDVIFTQDTHEIVYIDSDKNQQKMGSRIPLFINKSVAISQLNSSAVTYDGQPVGIRNDGGNYELYVVYHSGNSFNVKKVGYSDDIDAINTTVSGHVNDSDIHITSSERSSWNNKADASAFSVHANDSVIHITSNERNSWNAKTDNSQFTSHVNDNVAHVTQSEHSGYNTHVNDGDIHVTQLEHNGYNTHVADTDIHVTDTEHTTYNTHVQNSDIHVTTADKARWNSMGTQYQTIADFKDDLTSFEVSNSKHVSFTASAISAITNNKITSPCYGLMCKTSNAYYDMSLYADGYIFYMVRVDTTGNIVRVSRATLTTI